MQQDPKDGELIQGKVRTEETQNDACHGTDVQIVRFTYV